MDASIYQVESELNGPHFSSESFHVRDSTFICFLHNCPQKGGILGRHDASGHKHSN